VPGSSFFSELRRRKVLQAAAIYGAVAWGVTEVVVTVVEQLFLPQWVATLAVIGFVVGFPIAMFLAWTFDFTSEGIRRTDVTSRRGAASIVLSMALLLAGTAGLFFLIKPGLENRATPDYVADVSPNSVAVMPFDYSGPNPDDSYLGPGLSDELRDQLGRVDGLRIAARSSSIAAVQQSVDAKATALKLGVAHLLEGNMRRHGNVLRVSVQLIDGASGLAIWSDTFDRDRRELLNVQQDIAASVVRTVLPGSNQPVAEPATQNATANELMLLARHYEQQVRERQDVDIETLQRAVQYYRQAAEADPESALAQSRLAGALLYLGDIDGAEAHASAALLLNPNLAEVQYTFGKILFARGSPNMGEPLARAVELNPNMPDALADYAHWHWFNEGTDGVTELYQRALDLDPLNPARYAALGSFLALYDQPSEARALAERMQTIFDGATAYRAIAHVYDLVGDVDHAIAWTIKARDAEPDNPLHVERLAEFYTDIGDYETANALDPDIGVGLLLKMRRYDEMIDKAELQMIDYPEDIQLRVYLAFAYNATGRFEDAIRIITTSGVLNSYSHTRRNTEESDAFTALLNAAFGSGEIDQARELAEWRLATHYESDTNYWWVTLGRACTRAILGHDDEVHRQFQRTLKSNLLAWEPMLKDQQCFKRFADDPAYLAVVKHFDDRRAMLRKRLPATLAQYGVSL
jgi:TolB-like protein/tetratricopeptide (TPR) repeat protein